MGGGREVVMRGGKREKRKKCRALLLLLMAAATFIAYLPFFRLTGTAKCRCSYGVRYLPYVANDTPVDRVPGYSNGTKNGFAKWIWYFVTSPFELK